MKLLKNSLFIFCTVALVVACAKKPKVPAAAVKLNDFFELKMGQTAILADTDLKLSFVAVTEDSRCPRFTNCIQEGEVKLNVSASIAGKSQVVSFARKPSDKGATTVTAGAYKLQLFDVMPYPESGKPINPVDYVARMTVKKVE